MSHVINQSLPVKSLLAAVVGAMFANGVLAADNAVPDRRIGYVLYDYKWAVYSTPDGKQECPNGFDMGPREQFKVLFPGDGTKRKLVDTQLAREAEVWWPKLPPDPIEFKESQSKIAEGVNLDGRIGPNDFTSPAGEQGIDNTLSRALGCINLYRGRGIGVTRIIVSQPFNRLMIELTDVDNLTNDDDVTVTTYRGLDSLLTDAAGKDILPGGTQRIDTRWGKEFIYQLKGKIREGVLTTEPVDYTFPMAGLNQETTFHLIKGMRFKLKLTPDKAEGLMAGYTDIEAFYRHANQGSSTFHHGYGQMSVQSLNRTLHRLADAYPDPKTGQNTAISSALNVSYIRVFVQHPRTEKQDVSKETLSRLATQP